MSKLILGVLLMTSWMTALAQDAADDEKDRQYVTDQLRLSLYEDASSQSRVLKLLNSGDLLVIDEIRGPYALVTAPDGTHGWVKRGFLVTSPTSNILLQEEREKNAGLFEEIERLSNSKVVIDTYEKDMDELVKKIEALEKDKQVARDSIIELRQEIDSREVRMEQRLNNNLPPVIVLWETARAHWQLLVPVVLVLMLLCILVTKSVIEARIKSRFHGIKIW